jgi:hypothetical protein
MNVKNCPECDKTISALATRCRCGWEAKEAKSNWIQCAFDGCGTKATLYQKHKAGWANICQFHAMKIRQKEADEYCKSIGLNTPKQCRDWLLKNKLGVKRAPVIEREPGEDLEEMECPL